MRDGRPTEWCATESRDASSVSRDDSQPLDPRHAAAVEAFLAGQSIPEIAATAGVTRSTVWRWLQRPDCQAAILEAQRCGLEGAVATLRHSAGRAARRIVAAIDDEDPGLALRAAGEVLDRIGLMPDGAIDAEEQGDGSLTIRGERWVKAADWPALVVDVGPAPEGESCD